MKGVLIYEIKFSTKNDRTLNNTGNFTSNLFVRYVPTEKLYLETGVTHLGKRYYFNGNQQTILPSFTRVDAMVGYNLNPVNITFAVSNLSDYVP
ncbi:TonB-dependent receptor domain-containing protein [Avibacterium paragallinarum]|uniref:TonB-dependent receptor domain-containing protein n=1 Tax=Avibacterium paragallinarum TaxID=728 RepID=UPI0021F7A8E2|nr:TonB-dependent receptor [Avibacterium paragallinarum]UXN33786.1 TonB-dependent receptor [Avibacterium paragallinarum]